MTLIVLYVVLSGTMLTTTFGYHTNSSLTNIDPGNYSSIDSAADNGADNIAENILQSSTINYGSRNNSTVNSLEGIASNNKSGKVAEVTDNVGNRSAKKDSKVSSSNFFHILLFLLVFICLLIVHFINRLC